MATYGFDKIQCSVSPAEFCANCRNKVTRLEKQLALEADCNCPNCQEKKFSRCGRCHVVPYCSRECQVEDWTYHRKICKKFSRTAQKETSDYDEILSGFAAAGFNIFGPPQFLPFPFKLDDKHHFGWIDEYLAFLISLVANLQGIV